MEVNDWIKIDLNIIFKNGEFFLCDEVYSFVRVLLYFISVVGNGKVVWNCILKYDMEWNFNIFKNYSLWRKVIFFILK